MDIPRTEREDRKLPQLDSVVLWPPSWVGGGESTIDPPEGWEASREPDVMYSRCRDCHQAFVVDDMLEGCVCTTCAFTCDACGEPYNQYSYALRFPGGICLSCQANMIVCTCCGDLCDEAQTTDIDPSNLHGRLVCQNCLENYYEWCDDCDRYHYQDDYISTQHDGIHDYGYKPRPIFYDGSLEPVVNGSCRTDTFLGFELECEATRADRDFGVEIMQPWIDAEFAYLKHDGSLCEGFEIVSHPMTIEAYHALDYEPLEQLRKAGFRSWNTTTCGIHVHVSRKAFKSDAHQWRFGKLITGNVREMQKLAGRRGSEWASFEDNQHDVSMQLLKKGYPARYKAVNMQNQHTIEIRMFRGSLNVSRLLADLEFCDAAVSYTRDTTHSQVKAGALQWCEFSVWARHQGNRYLNLQTYLDVVNGVKELPQERTY